MSSSWSGQKKRSPVCMAAKAKNAKAATDHSTYGVKRQFASSASEPSSQRSKAPSRESRSPNRPQRHSPAPQRKSPRTTKRGKAAAGEQSVQEEGAARSMVRRAITGRENDRVDNEVTSDERDSELTGSLENCEIRKKSPIDRIVYTRDELMSLRKSESSNKIHEDLDERYIIGKKWNPDLWHQSVGPENSNRERDKGELNGTKTEEVKRSDGKRESDDAGDSSVDLRPHMGKSQTFRSSHRTGYENDNGLEWRRGKHSSENDGWEGRGSRRRNSDNGDWQIDHKRRPRLNSHSKMLTLEQPSVWSDEEEPEWMTHGPTSQLEFIELRGFDDEEERRENIDNEKNKPEEKSESLYDNGETETADSKLIECGGFDFDDFLKSASSFTETVEPVPDSSLNTNLNSSRFTQYFSMSEQSLNHQTVPTNHVSSHTKSDRLAPGVAALFQSANFSSNREIPPLALTEDELRQSDSVDDAAAQLQMFSRMRMLTQSKSEAEKAMSQRDTVRPGGRNYVLDGDRELEANQNIDDEMEMKDRNKASPQPRVPAAFLPTAVIRKMHNEGHLQLGQLNDKMRSDSRHVRPANSASPTALADLSDSSRMRVLQEHKMRQQELLWQQQRARQEFIRQRQILHEQQIGRQRELQRRALVEAEIKRRQAQLLTLRKFAIDRGLPSDTDPRVVYHLFQQYQFQKMRQMQLRQIQQQQQHQRSLSPVGGTGVPGYASQTVMAQQMARLGVRVSSSGQFHGAVGGDSYRLKVADQSSGGKSPGRNSPVAFTGTPPPSLRPIPHHPLPQLTHEQLLAAHRARLLQQPTKESESATAAALSKWFGQQQSPNSTDGVKSLEQMMSVKELEQKQAD